MVINGPKANKKIAGGIVVLLLESHLILFPLELNKPKHNNC